jgi:hypothetical protein
MLFLAVPGGAQETHDRDWLIARKAGKWEFVADGPSGRVAKAATNQEVMRLDAKTGKVVVLTLPLLEENEEMYCPERERFDPRSACSSAFLECRKAPAGMTMAMLGQVLGRTPEDSRNRLACRIDGNAILQAAKSVGLIKTVPPLPPAPPPKPWWHFGLTVDPPAE